MPDPHIVFPTHEQCVDVYLKDKLIYRYGWDIKDSFSLGSHCNIISLSPEYKGKTLSIRVYSHSPVFTGEIQDLFMGSGSDIKSYMNSYLENTFRYVLDSLILSFIFVFLGFALIFIFLIWGTSHTEFIHLGFASVLMGLWLLSENSLNTVLIDMPILWAYIAYFSIQLLLPCFCIFTRSLFGDTKHQILRKLAYAFLLCLLINFILDALNIVSWSVTIRVFHLLLVIGILGMLKAVISKFKTDMHARLFAFGFIVLSLTGICDMINRFYIPIPFLLHHRVTQWGMFFFIITLLYILGLNFTSIFDRLKLYSKEIEDKNMSLRAMWSELRESRDKIAEWNISLEQIVKQKTFAIKNLLNNADQGFLTFGKDIVIDEEPSKECSDIFGREVTGIKFVELFEMQDEEKKYLELMLTKIFDEKSGNKRRILIPLLPVEYYVNSKYVTVRYKMIENGHEEIMMVILTDITEKKYLENKIEDERNTLRMVVTAVTSHFELSKAIKRYNCFCRKELQEILDGSQPISEKISEIYRSVHTFKSIFAQLDMVKIVKKLHEFEDNIYELKNSASNKSSEEIISLFKNSGMSDWLDDDICILKETLGENFFEHEKIMIVDTTKLIELESKISSTLTSEQLKKLLPEIRKLRYRPFIDILRPYHKYINELSERLQKSVNQVFEGDEILIDTEKYYDFSKSLIHVFKNMLDHGIETKEKRLESGKSEIGTIKCSIRQADDNICINISDDGHGINIEALKRCAVSDGIYTEDELSRLSSNELLNLVFVEGITTKETTDEVSGRGMGLASLKNEVIKLGGSIRVTSVLNMGTEFIITLPIE